MNIKRFYSIKTNLDAQYLKFYNLNKISIQSERKKNEKELNCKKHISEMFGLIFCFNLKTVTNRVTVGAKFNHKLKDISENL